jgi:hypothetical protein
MNSHLAGSPTVLSVRENVRTTSIMPHIHYLYLIKYYRSVTGWYVFMSVVISTEDTNNHSSLFAGVRFKDPSPCQNQKSANNWPTPPKAMFYYFFSFPFFLVETIWFYVSLQLCNVMRYASTTRSSCHIILTLPSIEGSEWSVFTFGVTTRICETANYEPAESEGWVYKMWGIP